MHAHVRPPAPAWAVLALGLLVLVAGLFTVLSQRAQRLAGTNDVSVTAVLPHRPGSLRACQAGELLPADATAAQLSLQATAPEGGPPVRVVWRDREGRALAHGALPGGWRDRAPAIPLRRAVAVARDVRGELCVVLGRPGGVVLLGEVGAPSPGSAAGARATGGRMRVEYLRAGRETWWSVAPAVADRMGRGRGLGGPSVPALIAVLALGVVVVAVRLLRTGR